MQELLDLFWNLDKRKAYEKDLIEAAVVEKISDNIEVIRTRYIFLLFLSTLLTLRLLFYLDMMLPSLLKLASSLWSALRSSRTASRTSLDSPSIIPRAWKEAVSIEAFFSLHSPSPAYFDMVQVMCLVSRGSP
jgi:hypothetical protein